jgi:hypothetical protein
MSKSLSAELTKIINRIHESETYTRYTSLVESNSDLEIDVEDLPGVYSFRYTDIDKLGYELNNILYDVKIDSEAFYKYNLANLNVEVVSNHYKPRVDEFVSLSDIRDIQISNLDSLSKFNLCSNTLIYLDDRISTQDYKHVYNLLSSANYKHDYILCLYLDVKDWDDRSSFITLLSFISLLQSDVLSEIQNKRVFGSGRIILSGDEPLYVRDTFSYLQSALSHESIDVGIDVIVKCATSDIVRYSQIKSILDDYYDPDSVFMSVCVKSYYMCEIKDRNGSWVMTL